MNFSGIAQSEKIKELLNEAKNAAKLPRPIMIRGERGTGKELLAKYIHNNSTCFEKNFITLNCGNSNDELLNTELYGHEKGAFTGAYRECQGKFSYAEKGSLFLDEIGNMSLRFQETLLRVIEYGEIQKVGSSKIIKNDV